MLSLMAAGACVVLAGLGSFTTTVLFLFFFKKRGGWRVGGLPPKENNENNVFMIYKSEPIRHTKSSVRGWFCIQSKSHGTLIPVMPTLCMSSEPITVWVGSWRKDSNTLVLVDTLIVDMRLIRAGQINLIYLRGLNTKTLTDHAQSRHDGYKCSMTYEPFTI